MGLFKFFEKIFAWIPLVTFATVNEITIPKHTANQI